MALLRGLVVAVGALLMLVGCTSEPNKEDSMVSVEQMREQVSTRAQEVAQVMTTAGFVVPSASGRYVVCGVEPVSSVQCRAGVAVTGEGDLAARTGRVSA